MREGTHMIRLSESETLDGRQQHTRHEDLEAEAKA
jgi:hypothetical protein